MDLNSKLYVFAGVVGNYTRYAYRALGLPQLFSWVTGAVTEAKGGGGKGKANLPPKTHVRWNLRQVVPVPEDSPCGCEGDVKAQNTVFIEFVISGESDSAVRADLLAQIQALVLTPEFTGSVTNLEQPYS